MDPRVFDLEDFDMQWCPGCGNFQIMEALKKALAELGLGPADVVFHSGIGQAAKTPHFMKGNFFNGLHGRSVSNATGMKAANPELTVFAIGGDGDMYGEGGNHFLHTIRRNPDIVNIVHNNMVYGLTKGQASPTSPLGFKTPVQVDGVFEAPINPMAVALAQGAGFVARAFSGYVDQTAEIIKRAVRFRGYALVDIFQPCVSFNKTNTFKWFKDNTGMLPDGYDAGDREAALSKAMESRPYQLGVLYESATGEPFENHLACHDNGARPLYEREVDMEAVKNYLCSMQ